MVFLVVSVHVDVGGVLIGRILQTYYVNDSFAKLVPVWWRSFLELEKPVSLNYSTSERLGGLPKLYHK